MFTLVFTAGFVLPSGWGEVKEIKREELFSTQGTITRMKADQKRFTLKNEGGLELTFYTGEATTLADLAVGDAVEIDYLYNENYEKIAQAIKKGVIASRTE